ncbi:MAG: dynamin family protein [Pseudomonadota bacterium]
MQSLIERPSMELDQVQHVAAEVDAVLTAATDALTGERRASQVEIRDALRNAPPVISVVGQVKAGKTALSNALLRRPRLLPSDVNPWTSAVTAVRLGGSGGRDSAAFRFLSQEDWTALRENGGHLGELARRTGHADEAATLARQVDGLRARAIARLGRNFEALLGGEHSFDSVSPELIGRYVAGGSEPDSETVGRYAEITKSAEITLGGVDGLARIIRDTPGVNDPLLIREAMTLDALKDTDICVVTLSAGQAMTLCDLSLIRVLFAIKAENIVIFVNRSDELTDPAAQMTEIRARILETFAEYGLNAVPPVVFGSAAWAEAALTGDVGGLSRASRAALLEAAVAAELSLLDAAWAKSGIAELEAVIAEMLGAGVLRRRFGHALRTTLSHLRAEQDAGALRARPAEERPATAEVSARVERIRQTRSAELDRALDSHALSFKRAFTDLIEDFIAEQTKRLRADVEAHGPMRSWMADAIRFRRIISGLYQQAMAEQTARFEAIFQRTARDLSQIYADLAGTGAADRVTPPMVPDAGAPIAIGRTLAIDMAGRWWHGLLSRTSRTDRIAQEIATMIRREGKAILDQLEGDNRLAQAIAARSELTRCIEAEGAALLTLAAGRGATPPTPVSADVIEQRVLRAFDAVNTTAADVRIAAQ